jgi:hypothetical protein
VEQIVNYAKPLVESTRAVIPRRFPRFPLGSIGEVWRVPGGLGEARAALKSLHYFQYHLFGEQMVRSQPIGESAASRDNKADKAADASPSG